MLGSKFMSSEQKIRVFLPFRISLALDEERSQGANMEVTQTGQSGEPAVNPTANKPPGQAESLQSAIPCPLYNISGWSMAEQRISLVEEKGAKTSRKAQLGRERDSVGKRKFKGRRKNGGKEVSEQTPFRKIRF